MTTSYSVDHDYIGTSNNASKPAMLAPILDLARQYMRNFRDIRENHRRRALFVALLKYDDHMLEDMGLTHNLIVAASRLPLKVNAARVARDWTKRGYSS